MIKQFEEIKSNLEKQKEILLDAIGESEVFGELVPISLFSSNVDLPLKVHGILIQAGDYPDKRFGNINLSWDLLQSTAKQWEGVELFKSHDSYYKLSRGEPVPIDDVVGVITKVVPNDSIRALEFFGEIDDADIAFKIMRGRIRHVSVSFGYESRYMENKYYYTKIEPKETSLVYSPRCKIASIAPYKR